jgi:inosine-uridine nucleoside N-ribohydrolase
VIAQSKQRVWIDLDLSIGKIFLEVDDGHALVYALDSREKLEILGISTVFGNIKNHKYMIKTAYKILNKMGVDDISVYEGASGPEDLGSNSKAVEAMILALEEGPLKIIAMGRMTNVASVALLRPDLISNIETVILNAGRRLESPTRFGKKGIIFPDTNIDGDPEAIKILRDNRIHLTMIPVEAMTEMLWRKKELRALRKKGGIYKWLANQSSVWRFIWSVYPGSKGFIPWDVFLVTYLTNFEDFSCYFNIPYDVVYMKNDAHSLFRKKYRKEFKDFLVVSQRLEDRPLSTYCYDIDLKQRSDLTERASSR